MTASPSGPRRGRRPQPLQVARAVNRTSPLTRLLLAVAAVIVGFGGAFLVVDLAHRRLFALLIAAVLVVTATAGIVEIFVTVGQLSRRRGPDDR